jgi:hypothetical protein
MSGSPTYRNAGRRGSRGRRVLHAPACGSSEPVPKDQAWAHPGGGADLAMRCEDCENATEMTLVLSPEEAKALGLHALRELPEAPDNPPQGGATSS